MDKQQIVELKKLLKKAREEQVIIKVKSTEDYFSVSCPHVLCKIIWIGVLDDLELAKPTRGELFDSLWIRLGERYKISISTEKISEVKEITFFNALTMLSLATVLGTKGGLLIEGRDPRMILEIISNLERLERMDQEEKSKK